MRQSRYSHSLIVIGHDEVATIESRPYLRQLYRRPSSSHACSPTRGGMLSGGRDDSVNPASQCFRYVNVGGDTLHAFYVDRPRAFNRSTCKPLRILKQFLLYIGGRISDFQTKKEPVELGSWQRICPFLFQ